MTMWDSGTDKLRRKCVPGYQLVPTPSPEICPPYHNTQHMSGQCTSLGDSRAERSRAGQNAKKGLGSSATSQKKWLFQTRSCPHYSWKWNKTVAVCAKMATICLGDFNNHTLIRCYRWMTHLTHSFTFWKIRIIQIGSPQYFMRLIQ